MQTIPRYFVIALLHLGVFQALAHAQDSRGENRNDASTASVRGADGGTEATDALDEPGEKWFFQGWASEEYRFRHSSGTAYPAIDGVRDDTANVETDHDLRLFLNGHLSEGTDRFAADLSLGVWYDPGGTREPSSDPTAFGAIADHNTPEEFHDAYDVYSLYAEYRGRGVLGLVRGGRQGAMHGVPATFDGATVELRPVPTYLDLVFFGGRTVHFFDLHESAFENWLAAAVAVVRPLPELRLEVEYRFLKEETSLNRDIEDHSYGVTAWYRMTEEIWLKGFVRGLDTSLSHVGLDTRFAWPELGLGADTSVHAQLIRLGEINQQDNPYFAILGQSLPFLRFRADLWKELSTDVGIYAVHLGWNGRMLTEDEPTPFNRNFGRAYVLFQATDIGVKGPFASAIVEYHHPLTRFDVSSETLFSVGGSAGYQRKSMTGEIGSYYDRYKYNYYRNVEERQNSRTYYGEFRYDPLRWLQIRVRYEYERLDRDIHTVTLRLTQNY